MKTTKAKVHSMILDTYSDTGHWIYVLDCPTLKRPVLIFREGPYSEELCFCNEPV